MDWINHHFVTTPQIALSLAESASSDEAVAVGVAAGLAASTGYALFMGWRLALPAETIAGGVGAGIVIGAVAGLYPARRAARLTPAEALATT